MQAGSGRTQGIDALDIRHYLRVVWKRKWLIVAVVAATTGAAWIFRSRQVPTFQAATTVLIEPEPPRVVGYGAPAKGNTLLNYCGVRTGFIAYTVDRSPHKQGMFLPGTRIPIHAPERIAETRPDYLLILPWNLKDEIMEQMAGIREWGGRFVIPVPRVEVYA